MSHATESPLQPEFLSVRQVSALTSVSAAHLTRLRLSNSADSPPFFKLGKRVIYPLAGIRSWAEARLAAGSEAHS